MPNSQAQGARMPLRCLPLPNDGDGFPETRQALLPAVTSSAHLLSDDGRSLWIDGQDTTHHRADPRAFEIAASLGLGPGPARRVEWSLRAPFFVCLEDSWSGHAVAQMLRQVPPQRPVTLLHLDDHMDLGPTLLTRAPSGGLMDPIDRCSFDPADPTDWVGAIGSGAVNIGNWLTATLLHLMARPGAGPVTVQHLVPPGNTHIRLGRSAMAEVPLSYSVLPNHTFAGVDRLTAENGTHIYHATQDIDAAFSTAKDAHVILHIDLDVFVNDFNGGSADRLPYRTSSGHWQRTVLEALGRISPHLAGITVATSPGFCSAVRWSGLLSAIRYAQEDPFWAPLT